MNRKLISMASPALSWESYLCYLTLFWKNRDGIKSDSEAYGLYTQQGRPPIDFNEAAEAATLYLQVLLTLDSLFSINFKYTPDVYSKAKLSEFNLLSQRGISILSDKSKDHYDPLRDLISALDKAADGTRSRFGKTRVAVGFLNDFIHVIKGGDAAAQPEIRTRIYVPLDFDKIGNFKDFINPIQYLLNHTLSADRYVNAFHSLKFGGPGAANRTDNMIIFLGDMPPSDLEGFGNIIVSHFAEILGDAIPYATDRFCGHLGVAEHFPGDTSNSRIRSQAAYEAYMGNPGQTSFQDFVARARTNLFNAGIDPDQPHKMRRGKLSPSPSEDSLSSGDTFIIDSPNGPD